MSMLLAVAFISTACLQTLNAIDADVEKLKKASQTASKGSHEKIIASGTQYDDFQKGQSFQTGNNTYIFLPELYSGRESQQKSDAGYGSLSSIQEEKSANLVEKKGRFSIFRSGEDEGDSMSAKVSQNKTLYPVVLNPNTNQLAIVPGTIKVTLDDMYLAESIAIDFRLQVFKKFGHLKTVYYKVDTGDDILAKTTALESDPRVNSAAIEVVEEMNEPH